MLSVALLVTLGWVSESDAPLSGSVVVGPVAAGPVAYVGHGAMFARDGTELAPTNAFIAKTQAFYRGQLLQRASAKQRSRLKALRTQVSTGLRLDKRHRLIIDVLLLDWLIRRVAPPDAERLLGINYHLKQALRSDDIPKALRSRLLRAGLTSKHGTTRAARSAFLVTPTSGQAYRTLCQQNGVPIPPDWGTPQWVKQGNLTSVFISTDLQAEVFTSQSSSPEGMSIALPRYEGNTIKLLGIISLGKQSGKVCFWDNQTGNSSSPQFFPQRNELVPIDRFGGGTSLLPGVGGRCSSCHAGENPYIIHPATVLGQLKAMGLPTFANSYYEPIVESGFPENPIPTLASSGPASSGPCSGCHTAGGPGGRFPELSTAIIEYCGILKAAIQGAMSPPPAVPVQPTMPPSSPGSLANDPQPIALLQQCKYFVSQTPPPSTVFTNSQFNASVTFANTDRNTTWTGSHTLSFAPPSSGPVIWQATASFNSSLGTQNQPILPGNSVSRTATVLTPSQPGTYEFAWVLRDPTGKVIGRSPSTLVTVVNPVPVATPSASLVITIAPGSLQNGQSGTVSVVATNDGSTKWTASDHIVRLGRIRRISLPQFSVAVPSGGVAPGASFTFTFTIICNGNGQGGFTAQMAGPAGPFGQSVGRTVVCQ